MMVHGKSVRYVAEPDHVSFTLMHSASQTGHTVEEIVSYIRSEFWRLNRGTSLVEDEEPQPSN